MHPLTLGPLPALPPHTTQRLSGMRRLPGRPGLARMSSDPLRTHHADSFGEGSGAAAVRSRLVS